MLATNINDLPTVYNAGETEESIYKFWEENDLFRADAKSPKKPYSIVIPPPNVTGVLHMGHALDETLQDILVRYHRMSGYETLWVPGTDHAGIATQNVVEKKLREQGISRHDIGREKFLEETWNWANAHKSRILDQCKRLGASFDRSRERFTFDQGCSDAVKEVFVRLYEKGLIYKGAYIVNWCPRCQSAISDVETEYETEQGHLWEISYPLKGESGAIIVATTRPETIFGDVAIAVHPSDHKYSELIGKTVVIPLTGREIPIIADEYVDKTFGTGAVKITPAHDPNDFEVGKRHNFSPIWVIDEQGKMKACGEVPCNLHGLDRYEARKQIIKMLDDTDVKLGFENGTQCVYLNGEEVSAFIRTPEISMGASKVSAIPKVREYLLDLQRDIAKKNNVIMDGRDIGTVVLPNAECKIFLTASPQCRAQRRYKELIEKGENVKYEDVLNDVNERDYNDSHRKIAPLKPSEESVIADTSKLSLDESIALIVKIIKEHM